MFSNFSVFAFSVTVRMAFIAVLMAPWACQRPRGVGHTGIPGRALAVDATRPPSGAPVFGNVPRRAAAISGLHLRASRSDRVLRWTQRLRAQEKLAKSSPVSCCATAVCCCATAVLVANGFQTYGISPVGMWNAGNRP